MIILSLLLGTTVGFIIGAVVVGSSISKCIEEGKLKWVEEDIRE